MKDHLEKLSFITQDDLNFMYEQTFLFQEWKRSLLNMREAVSVLPAPHKASEQYNVKNQLKNELYYSKTKMLEELDKKLEHLVLSFLHAIRHYLRLRYQFADIPIQYKKEYLENPDLKEEDYVQDILDQLSREFGQKSASQIRLEEFCEEVWKKKPTVQGRVLEFSSNYRAYWRAFTDYVSTDFVKTVFLIENYRQFKDFNLPQEIQALMKFNSEEGILATHPSMERYRIYKNGKLSFTFKTKEGANAFLQLVETYGKKEDS